MKENKICENCSIQIKKRQKYCLRIQLYAAPEVELDEKDLSKNNKKAMEEIREKVKGMSAKKLEEDVYICYDFVLCKKCRDIFLGRIKLKEFI